MDATERSEIKKKNARKCINFIISLIRVLDDSIKFPGVEYNLTCSSKDFVSAINKDFGATTALDYSSLITLRVTRHLPSGKRSDPLYVTIVAKLDTWTYVPVSICVYNKALKHYYGVDFDEHNSVILADNIAEFVKSVLVGA